MDNTTLHTFLFQCPSALRSVALFGSWDNFSRPYHLELDSRGGRNFWKGCFTFSDVFCDGDLEMLSPKRDGPLKMGGKYWYYYEVDGEKEVHNPSEPATTVCPLLPGQHLNILDVPIEGRSHSDSVPCAFTLDPSDRYLTPVPPSGSTLQPPSYREANTNSYTLPSPVPWAPKSATYPSIERHLSPNPPVRHARSASGSPLLPSGPLLAEFKGLKEKIASRRSQSRSHSSPNVRGLVIGAPTLVSTTVDCVDQSTLPSNRPTPNGSPAASPRRDTQPSPYGAPGGIATNDFAPLISHPPATPPKDPVLAIAELPADVPVELPGDEPPPRRRRSHVPSTNIDFDLRAEVYRNRANSTDTRRTESYISRDEESWPLPRGPLQPLGHSVQEATEIRFFKPALVLQRFKPSLAPPSEDERPSSRAGGRSFSRNRFPCDKELPALPQYLEPAPLFASDSQILPAETPVQASFNVPRTPLVEEYLPSVEEEPLPEYFAHKPPSRFSTWSSDLISDSYQTSDDDVATSPTFSSLTSDFSDTGSPGRSSMRCSFAPESSDEHDENTDGRIHYLSATPPQLDCLRLSMFGTDLLNFDEIRPRDTLSRRQATCFGLGFQGYSLPEDETSSKTTITTESTLLPQHTVSVKRESSVSQLMDDFSYLGECVI